MYVSSCLVFIHFKKPFEFWGLLILRYHFRCSYFYNHFKGETATRTTNMYKRLQLVSSASFSIGHGGSDAQKIIGIIGAAMVAQNFIPDINQYTIMGSVYVLYGNGFRNYEWRLENCKNNGHKNYKSIRR